MKTRSMYEAERMSLDRMSTLPQPILETILCLLTTKEAARTSILSREWRYKWTNIPKLRFYLRKRTSDIAASTMKSMDMHDVSQVLLLHQGPIRELSLSMEDYWEHYDCFELDQIILQLSRNHTLNTLALDGEFDDSENIWYQLPPSVFALRHLTDLHLDSFDIDHPSIFNGFGSLGTLRLKYVKISTQTLLHLLSNCPSLKNLSLHIDESGDKCTITELIKCLRVIEHLTISGDVSEWLDLDSVAQEPPTSLIHLKYLCLNEMCLVGADELAFLLVMIKCSPNLERMYLEMECGEEFSAIKKELYSEVWLGHLNDLQICFCTNLLETDFVKFILARSPKLKNLNIRTVVDHKQESKMFKTLLRAPRASPTVNFSTDNCLDAFRSFF